MVEVAAMAAAAVARQRLGRSEPLAPASSASSNLPSGARPTTTSHRASDDGLQTRRMSSRAVTRGSATRCLTTSA